MLLDQAKVDIKSGDSNGWTPIYYAAKYGQVEVIKLLLERAPTRLSRPMKDSIRFMWLPNMIIATSFGSCWTSLIPAQSLKMAPVTYSSTRRPMEAIM